MYTIATVELINFSNVNISNLSTLLFEGSTLMFLPYKLYELERLHGLFVLFFFNNHPVKHCIFGERVFHADGETFRWQNFSHSHTLFKCNFWGDKNL